MSFLTVDQVKPHLNIAPTNSTHDVELEGFIASACEVVESIVGIVELRSFTETHSGRGESRLVLRQHPAVSVTSVTQDGDAVDAAGYSLSSSGLLTRKSGYRAVGCWVRGVDNITVTYTAGRADVPASVADGTKELIRVNWRPQAGGNHSVFDQGRSDDFGQSGAGEVRLGFFIPNTVMQRLQPHARGALVA